MNVAAAVPGTISPSSVPYVNMPVQELTEQDGEIHILPFSAVRLASPVKPLL